MTVAVRRRIAKSTAPVGAPAGHPLFVGEAALVGRRGAAAYDAAMPASNRRPTSRVGLILLVGLSLVAVAVVSRLREGTDQVAWQTDLPAAGRAAAAARKPVLLDFTASWCPPCQEMRRTTWADRATAALVSDRCVPVSVDIDAHQDLARRYAVESIPTLVLTTPDGRELRRVVAYQSSDDVRKWLDGRP